QEIGTSGLGRLSLRNPSHSKKTPPHMRTLGICWIVYGILRLAMGAAAVLFASTATVMFGALLTRVPNPFAWMDLFHVLFVGFTAVAFTCGILGILGGFALLGAPASRRGLLLAASFLSLPDLPLGIGIGVYTLIVLLRPPTVSLDAREPAIHQGYQ